MKITKSKPITIEIEDKKPGCKDERLYCGKNCDWIGCDGEDEPTCTYYGMELEEKRNRYVRLSECIEGFGCDNADI